MVNETRINKTHPRINNIPPKTPVSNANNTKETKLKNHLTLQQRPSPKPLPCIKVKDWIQLSILPKQDTKTRKGQSMP